MSETKMSSAEILEQISSIMDSYGSVKDLNQGRAIAFAAAILRPLCFLRDKGLISLNSKTFKQFFALDVVERMVFDRAISKDGQDIKITDSLFDEVLKPLKSYLLVGLPLYEEDAKGNQSDVVREQHSYRTMQLSEVIKDVRFS